MSRAVRCIFCCNATELRSLLLPYDQNGKTEVYAEIVEKCFCIQVLTEEEDPDKNKYMICEGCIARLKDVLRFRTQVEVARDSIREIEHPIEFEDDTCSDRVNHVKMKADIEEDTFENDSFNDGFSTDLDVEEAPCEEEKSEKVNTIELNLSKEIDDKKNQKEENAPKIIDNNFEISKKMLDIKKVSKEKIDQRRQNYLKKNRNLKCNLCDKVFHSFLNFSIHKSIHFPNFICQVCGKAFSTKNGIKNHLTSHDKMELKCEFCDKVFDSKIKLRNHKRFHKTKNIHCCPYCLARFPSYAKRVEHLANVHNEELKKHKCTYCPKKYKLASVLRYHIQLSHFNIKKFQCKICHRHFGSSGILKNHMNSHNKIKKFQCEICSKFYVKQYTLNEHLKIHYNIKNFVCPVCNRAFTQKCTLKGHMKVHEKEQEPSITSSDIVVTE